MFNKEFLKTLTIMYVEDDESIRNSLGGILTKIFGEVILCSDGAEGVEKFVEFTQTQHKKIDAIISDINMPNMNGLEMIGKIREYDQEIPIILTTAHGESNYLMEAIKLKVVHYALKPINTTELLQNISKFCMIEHNKELVKQKEKEISLYMDIMNSIASIIKLDTDGRFVDINSQFQKLTQYDKDELLGQKIDIVLDQTSVIKSFEDTINLKGSSTVLKEKIRFVAKDGTILYLNISILPIKNDNTGELEGYVYIGIDQTKQELEKAHTMQKVRKNIMSQKTKESELLKKTKELEAQLEHLKNNTISIKDSHVMMGSLNKEKQKVAALNAQIGHYEKEILTLTKQRNVVLEQEKSKKLEAMKKAEAQANEREKMQSKIIELQAKVKQLEAKQKAKIID